MKYHNFGTNRLAIAHLACAALVSSLVVPLSRAEVVLPRILGDHMVLQSGMDAPIWGKASAGEDISVRGDWQSRAIRTRAGKDGRWRINIPTPKAGGPHLITINGLNEIVLHDVHIGEVWICSGQSNMEMPVGNFGPGYDGVDHWEEELKNANLPAIRLFTVPNRHSLAPQFDCEGSWVICNAETAKAFSAAGFFFGRELHQKLKVPVGLISADYGGTVAEAWASEDTIRSFPDFAPQLQAIVQEREHAPEAARARAEGMSHWIDQIEAADGGAAFAAVNLDDAGWSIAPKLEPWGGALATFDGYVWFRKSFQVPAEWAEQAALLELGPIDDLDFTYVNGAKIGQTAGELSWNIPRQYALPKGRLHSGTNVIAVRVLDTGGNGGITGPARLTMAGQPAISLHENWRFKPAARLSELPALNLPVVVNPNTATVLFNGMIAPIIPFGIRGAIWYQGESNIGRDEQYRRLFPAMIADWRRHWGEGDFPFYFTQIAPFRYSNSGQSAALRDAQRRSLKTPNTGMAVTMDSDSNNLHPHTKQAVGHRLALWALAKTYGQRNLVFSGPLYKRMKIQGETVRLYFDHVDGGLMAQGKSLEHFEIAGPEGRFVPARAEIEGDTIVVSSADVKSPSAVRYGWGDADESSFGNRANLPAASFQTDAATQ
jgi:sialate O-acetylesterase